MSIDKISFCVQRAGMSHLEIEAETIEHLARALELCGQSKRDCSNFELTIRGLSAVWERRINE